MYIYIYIYIFFSGEGRGWAADRAAQPSVGGRKGALLSTVRGK